ILVGGVFFLFGFFAPSYSHPGLLEGDQHHLLHYVRGRLPCTISGVICKPKRALPGRERLAVAVDSLMISPNEPPLPVRGGVYLNLYDVHTDFDYGDRITASTNLRRPVGFRNENTFNYRRHLERRGIYATGSISNKEKIERLDTSQGIISGIIRLRREASRLAESAIHDEEAAAVFNALVLGERGYIPPPVTRAFQRTGTMHLLAVSGLHLGFVLLFCLALIRLGKRAIPVKWLAAMSRITPYSRVMSLVAVLPLSFYTLLTGMRLSTVRALIMIALYLVAYFFDRLHEYFTTLAWAALVILLWRPLSILAIDFQFTFLATLGVIAAIRYHPPLLAGHPWIRRGFDLFFVSTAAVVITAPLCAMYFHYLSPGGVLITPLILPLLSLIVPGGLIATLCIPIHHSLARPLMAASGFGIRMLLTMLSYLGTRSWTFLPVPSPPVWGIMLFYLALGCAVWAYVRRRSRLAPFLGISLLVLISFFPVKTILLPSVPSGDTMEVTFMDVGKGDAALIRCPEGQNIIIDGGGTYDHTFDIGELVLTPFLWSKGVTRIRAVAVSHPHPDHLNGLFAVLRNFPVEEVWVAEAARSDKRYRELAALMAAQGTRERVLKPGDRIPISPTVGILCLHPPDRESIVSPRGENSRINNHSMVLKVTFHDVSLLFTGDIEKEAERYLVDRLPEGVLASTVLKAPHHGSKHSGTLPFLRAVSPRITVLSTRRNSWYPLPAPSTIKRIQSLPTMIYRTDLHGAITLHTNGATCLVTTWEESQRQTPLLKSLYETLTRDMDKE
ncbi:MAG: DNA internalization-related competence protein ComEC/Rec2, partial [bacterium]